MRQLMTLCEQMLFESHTVAEKYIADVYRRLKRLGHANIIAYLTPENDQQVSLDSIDAAVQGKGFGERAMKIITTQADRYGVTLTLAVSGNEAPSDSRLVRWYTRHGFAITETDHNPDDEPDQLVYTSMSRPPVLHETAMPDDDYEDIPSNPQGMIDAFEDAFEASGLAGQVTVSLMLDPDAPDYTVELNHISTKPESRGGGLANKTMALLTDMADQYNVVLRLGVAADADGRDDSLTGEQLVNWYAGWGFEGGHVMRRAPSEPYA